MEGLILETTFLIDLEREAARDDAGSAHRFLRSRESERLSIAFVTAGELAAGASLSEPERWLGFIRRFRVLQATTEVCRQYGTLYRYLQTNGLLIAGNDLWIAATALVNGLPLVTRNLRHFQRVPGLDIVAYE